MTRRLALAAALTLACNPEAAPVWRSVAVGSGTSCVLDEAGQAVCWGYDPPRPDGPWARIDLGGDAGEPHLDEGCGIRPSGEVTCWGSDWDIDLQGPAGEISVGSYAHGCFTSPDGVQCFGNDNRGASDPPAGDFEHVAAGGVFTCGLHPNDSMQCWGVAENFETSDVLRLVTLDASDDGICGVRTNGWVYCDHPFLDGLESVPGDPWVDVQVGKRHACALHASGALRCWGDLGDAPYGQLDVPPGNYIAVSTRAHHACAITDENSVECWGLDDRGQVSGAAVLDEL